MKYISWDSSNKLTVDSNKAEKSRIEINVGKQNLVETRRAE